MEERKDLGLAAVHGTAWRFLSYFGGKFMVFLSTIFLARLLDKDDFGIVGYALTAVALLDVASDLGVAEAVVYYAKDNRKYSTAFWISLVIGFALFGVSWALAPLLVVYFRDDRVLEISRVMALTFPFSALGSTHEALLRKNLAFERTTIPVFFRAVAKGLISIGLALMGFGAWSLVWGQLGGTLISSILLWVLTPWRPSVEFDFSSARSLLRYGMKDIGTTFLSMILLNLDYWLVGRYLGAEALGIYTLAYRLPELLILQFARIISQVNFPIYTKMRETHGSLARGFWKTTSYVSLLTIPSGLGLALLARPFTIVFLSEKWIEAVPVLQGIALYAMFLSLAHNATSAYKAQGNFGVITWLSVVRLSLLFPALWWATSVMRSIVLVGWMHAVIALISATMGLIVAARMLSLPVRELFTSIWPGMMAGIVMALVVRVILNLVSDMSSIMQLLVTVPLGALSYIATLWLANRGLLLEIIERLKSAISRRQGKYA